MIITELKLPGLYSRLQAGIFSCLTALYMVIPGDVVAQDYAGNAINLFQVTNDSFQTGSFLSQLRMPGPVQPVIPDPPVESGHASGEMRDQSVCTHVVQNGDTLSGIVKRYLGSSRRWPELMRDNPDVNPNHLKVGTVLNLPCAMLSASMVPTTLVWTAKAGEDFTTVLNRWSKVAGYRVVIQGTDTWRINVPVRLHTDFENAVAELVNGLGAGGRKPPVRVYSNRVIQMGDSR